MADLLFGHGGEGCAKGWVLGARRCELELERRDGLTNAPLGSQRHSNIRRGRRQLERTVDGQRAGAEAHATVCASQTVQDARVLEFFRKRLLGVGDQRRGGAEREQLEDESRERCNRRRLKARLGRPRGGQRRASGLIERTTVGLDRRAPVLARDGRRHPVGDRGLGRHRAAMGRGPKIGEPDVLHRQEGASCIASLR